MGRTQDYIGLHGMCFGVNYWLYIIIEIYKTNMDLDEGVQWSEMAKVHISFATWNLTACHNTKKPILGAHTNLPNLLQWSNCSKFFLPSQVPTYISFLM